LVMAGHPKSVIQAYDKKQFIRRNEIESSLSRSPAH
jgi:hypothetical protein